MNLVDLGLIFVWYQPSKLVTEKIYLVLHIKKLLRSAKFQIVFPSLIFLD